MLWDLIALLDQGTVEKVRVGFLSTWDSWKGGGLLLLLEGRGGRGGVAHVEDSCSTALSRGGLVADAGVVVGRYASWEA